VLVAEPREDEFRLRVHHNLIHFKQCRHADGGNHLHEREIENDQRNRVERERLLDRPPEQDGRFMGQAARNPDNMRAFVRPDDINWEEVHPPSI